MNYLQLHQDFKAASLFGRYITLEHIEPLLAKYNTEIVGQSVLGKPIHKLELGSGKIKILMWSQMHGNESTTTKALFDFINVLHSNSELSKNLLNQFTFCLIPMLNPDGAAWYTRENANGIDLNRDAQNLSQPESKILRRVFDAFSPIIATIFMIKEPFLAQVQQVNQLLFRFWPQPTMKIEMLMKFDSKP